MGRITGLKYTVPGFEWSEYGGCEHDKGIIITDCGSL